MTEKLISLPHPPASKTEPARWFLFRAHQLLVAEGQATMSVPLVVEPASLGLKAIRERYLGSLSGRHCYCAEISENDPIPLQMGCYGLRYLYGHLDESLFAVAVKAVHLLEWEGNTRYCGRCGKEMAPAREMNGRQCSGCGMLVFPRISPAVITLVERDGMVLLARSTRFTANVYSVLAGFVEPGETLEDAVHREIEEEVGIRVRNVRYFGSQPWPFPDSLMVGFTAQHAGGEINIDKNEIVDAGWFHPDQLPTLPGKISIARRLIDRFIEIRSAGKAATGPRLERHYDPGE